MRDIDNDAVREAQIRRLAQIRARRDAAAVERALAKLTELAGSGRGQPARGRGRGGARARERRRDLGGAGEGLHAPPRGGALGVGSLRRRATRATTSSTRCAARSEAFAARGGPPPAHAGREARPGRPRPRPEGDRHRLRRPRLRRRRRAAVPDARGGGAPGDRERRARGRRLEPGRRPQDAGAGAGRGAARAAARATSRWSSAASSRPQDYAFLRERGVAAVFGPGTPVPKAAREVLAAVRDVRERSAAGMSPRRAEEWSRGGPRRRPARGRARPSRCSRARAARTRCSRQALLEALVPAQRARACGSASPARRASARARSSRRSAST